MVCLAPRESAQNELGVGIWDVNLKVKRGRFGGRCRGILSDVCILINTHVKAHVKRGFIPPGAVED
jgi:hypothetical protein